MMIRRASIDLGTNTCLLLLAEWDGAQSGVQQVIADVANVVRLGEGVDRTRKLQPAAMQRTLDCLYRYRDKVREAGVDPGQVVCVATSQARDASNSSEFFNKVRSETGFVFKTLTGDEEARFTFEGALLPGMDVHQTTLLDIGGGSTELITLNQATSIDMGSVRFTERFFKSDPVSPVSDEEFWACQSAIDEALTPWTSWRKDHSKLDKLVGVAGTVTSLAAWHLGLQTFDSSRVNGAILTRGDVHRLVEELKWRSVKERAALPCMEPLRADVILAGAMIFWRTMELLGFSECTVSTRGLRFGVLK